MESISAFEIIKVGIGPSSSHTMGPWKAARMFLDKLPCPLSSIAGIKVQLFGSLAKTGHGHGTDIAVLMGLCGEDYTTIDTESIPRRVDEIKRDKKLRLGGEVMIEFDPSQHLIFEFKESLPFHPNGMRITALTKDGKEFSEEYFSVGGGFVVQQNASSAEQKTITPYPCHDAATILKHCREMGLRVSDLVMLNEKAWRSEQEIKSQALAIWKEIRDCIYRGVNHEGILPGNLNVARRAFKINKQLLDGRKYLNQEEWIAAVKSTPNEFNAVNKWVSCFALAVNEENASFGRIVTAPTNGAAGVLPAVLMYAYCFIKNFDDDKIIRFILTAGEIGTLFKKKATISAAMGGCQAEIGVSSSMAAGALTEALGGTPGQVLMAAEIAMEHHLGLTCDPIGGLVQIPCIERNTMGAIKAITASNIAFESDPGSAIVSLDTVIKTMWDTARDMNSKYKETSEGGLATHISVNLAEC